VGRSGERAGGRGGAREEPEERVAFGVSARGLLAVPEGRERTRWVGVFSLPLVDTRSSETPDAAGRLDFDAFTAALEFAVSAARLWDTPCMDPT
jgi:hypothetical protein